MERFESLNGKNPDRTRDVVLSVDNIGGADKQFGVNINAAQELIEEREGVVSGEALERVHEVIAELQQLQFTYSESKEIRTALAQLIALRDRSLRVAETKGDSERDHAEALRRELERSMNPQLQ